MSRDDSVLLDCFASWPIVHSMADDEETLAELGKKFRAGEVVPAENCFEKKILRTRQAHRSPDGSTYFYHAPRIRTFKKNGTVAGLVLLLEGVVESYQADATGTLFDSGIIKYLNNDPSFVMHHKKCFAECVQAGRVFVVGCFASVRDYLRGQPRVNASHPCLGKPSAKPDFDSAYLWTLEWQIGADVDLVGHLRSIHLGWLAPEQRKSVDVSIRKIYPNLHDPSRGISSGGLSAPTGRSPTNRRTATELNTELENRYWELLQTLVP